MRDGFASTGSRTIRYMTDDLNFFLSFSGSLNLIQSAWEGALFLFLFFFHSLCLTPPLLPPPLTITRLFLSLTLSLSFVFYPIPFLLIHPSFLPPFFLLIHIYFWWPIITLSHIHLSFLLSFAYLLFSILILLTGPGDHLFFLHSSFAHSLSFLSLFATFFRILPPTHTPHKASFLSINWTLIYCSLVLPSVHHILLSLPVTFHSYSFLLSHSLRPLFPLSLPLSFSLPCHTIPIDEQAITN